MASSNIRGGRGYPPEPSIRNIEVWLDWQACQMDTPYWWVELTTIPDVEDPKKLAQKIHASFSILAVRCETSLGQEYTVPPAPKCLTRGSFIPNDPSYQDIQQQPLLMTVAYTQALQYWVEKVRLPVHPGYCPLAMSIVELMQQVRGHITFYKWDIFWNLGRVALEIVGMDPVIPQGCPITQPTPTNIGGMKSNSVEAWGHITPPPLCPRRRPHQLNLLPHLPWLMLGILCLALWTCHWRGMPWFFQPNLKWKSQRACQLVKPLAQLGCGSNCSHHRIGG